MDYKLSLITPSLYSNVGATNCRDELVESFAHHLKYRSDTDFNLKCKYDPVPGLAFIHRFEDFEERFLIHSEYAVIIASPSSQTALNRFMPRLLVFLTAKPIWQNRFLFVILGEVNVLSNLVVNDPIEFSMNNWEDHDEESWIKLFDLIKIKWEPHVEKCDSKNILEQTSQSDSINEQINSTKESQSLLISEIGSTCHNNIGNTTLKTQNVDETRTRNNSTLSTESKTKIDESAKIASDLHGNVTETGNHSSQKDITIDSLRKENNPKENTGTISEEVNISDNILDKTNLTIKVTKIDETNLINVANTLNTSHEKNVKEENFNVDFSENSNLSNQLNNGNDGSLLLETKTNDNARIEEKIVEKEENLRLIKCASRKLQGELVTLEKILYFQSDKPINNESKIFENREMNTDESIFTNKTNEKELPPIMEHIKENIKATHPLSNQSSCTDSEQTFECDLHDQIIEEQDNEYEIQKEIIKKASGEFNFQSFDNEEEKEIFNGKYNEISIVENEKVKKEIVDEDIIVDSNQNLEKTMDQISTENLESIDCAQMKTDKEYSNPNDSQNYDNKFVEMENNSNFSVSNQLDKFASIKTKDENTDVDIICSGIGFGKTNEVSINSSILNKDDVEFNMISNENKVTLLELEFSNKNDTKVDHQIITQENLDSNITRDFSHGFNNFDREVSNNLHLLGGENAKTGESCNLNNNNNSNNNINAKIHTDLKPILNISESVDKSSLDTYFEESFRNDKQGFSNIGKTVSEIKSLEGPHQANVNKEYKETNENIDETRLERNYEFSEKIDSLNGDDSQFFTENNILNTESNNNETVSSIFDKKPEISIDNKINSQENLDSNFPGDSIVGLNRKVSDNLYVCSEGDLVMDESSNIINNTIEIDNKIDTNLKLILHIRQSISDDEMVINYQEPMKLNLDESRNVIIDNQESNTIVGITDITNISEESNSESNSETNENIGETSLDIRNEFSENIASLKGDDSQVFTENNILNTESKNNETISSIFEHHGLDNKPKINIDNKINSQENLDSNFPGDLSVGFNREVSDNLYLVGSESSSIVIDTKFDTDVKLISNISEKSNEEGMSINLQNSIISNLVESSNLNIENQDSNNIVCIADKINLSEESKSVNINKKYKETNENIDKTCLEENIDSLSRGIAQSFTENNTFGTDLKNNETLSSILKIDNQIIVENKCNEEIIDNENKINIKETEFISRLKTDVDNSDVEEQRKEFENRDQKNESFISEITNLVNDDEMKSSSHESIQSTVKSDTRLVIDEFDLNKNGIDVNNFDNENIFIENQAINKMNKNEKEEIEIFSQTVNDLKDFDINNRTNLCVRNSSDNSEQGNMNIGSRIHFTSDDIDIDINLYDNQSQSFNYGMIKEESKENMEEEGYISSVGENQGKDYCILNDFQGDQNTFQFKNEAQFSLEISQSNNKNNINLDFDEKTCDNLMKDQCKVKSINEDNCDQNKQASKENSSTTHENRINMSTEHKLKNSFEELNLLKSIENDYKYESENDGKNVKNKSTYSIFRIPLNCLYGLKRIPNLFCTVISANQSRISHGENEQLSPDTENSLTRCLHSPWCVLLLFVTGTLVSPYWVEITRNISQSAVRADLIIDKISSTILHEDSVNRKYAILPLENH